MARVRFLLSVFVLLAAFCRGCRARPRRWSVALRSLTPWRCVNSTAEGLASAGVLLPARSADMPLANSQLFALPSMAPVRKALDARVRPIHRAAQGQPAERNHRRRNAFDFQLFDRALLYSDRFALRAGGHRQPDGSRLCRRGSCGEIRLIYRLTRTGCRRHGDNAASPRLPMTLNVVLKAKGDQRSTAAARRSPAPRSRAVGWLPANRR